MREMVFHLMPRLRAMDMALKVQMDPSFRLTCAISTSQYACTVSWETIQLESGEEICACIICVIVAMTRKSFTQLQVPMTGKHAINLALQAPNTLGFSELDAQASQAPEMT